MTVRCILTLAGLVGAAECGFARQTMPVITLGIWKEMIPPIPTERIKEVVSGLAASDFEVREKAQATILTLGEKAAPQLRRALATVADAEARRRLSVIVKKLEYDRMTTARTVTLVADRMTAPDALRKLCSQSGYRIRCEGLGEDHEKKKRFDFAIRDRSFWEAIDVVCNRSGLGIQIEDDGGVRVYFQDAFNPHVSYSGPFRFVANQIHSGRYLPLGGLSRQALPTANPESLSINLTVFAEPKTTLVGVRGPWILKMIDEAGKAVPQPPIDQSQSYYNGSNGNKSFSHNLNLSFCRPAKEAIKIKEIRAKATLDLLTDIRPDVSIPDLLKAKGKKASGRSASIEITEVVETNGTATITATITNPTGNPNDYQWVNSLWQRFEVADASGEKFQVNITNTNYNTPQNVTVIFQAIPPDGIKCGPPEKFTLVEWITRTTDVEFTFKDIPLP